MAKRVSFTTKDGRRVSFTPGKKKTRKTKARKSRASGKRRTKRRASSPQRQQPVIIIV